MQHYRNIGGNSNVNSYAIGDTYLDVLFYGTPRVYRYSYKSAGVENVENMKVLAEQGYGLNSFINRYVKYKYERWCDIRFYWDYSYHLIAIILWRIRALFMNMPLLRMFRERECCYENSKSLCHRDKQD